MRNKLKAFIVMPTFNEAGNIEAMLEEVLRKTAPLDEEVHILVVDDNSPDGTGSLVLEAAGKNERIHLLHREEKEGLGAAYIAGFKEAVHSFKADIVLEMDADFSHNPNDVPRLIAEVVAGSDFVIGSRYVPGGSTPKDWGMRRRLVSKAANLAVKALLGVRGVRDCTGGFRAIKASVLERAGFEGLESKGYSFQAVLLERVLSVKGKVKEVPIAFSQRREGVSKLGFRDVAEGFKVLLRVRVKRFKELFSASK